MLRSISRPGVSRGTRNIEKPPCTPSSGLVTTMAIRNSAQRACEEKNFHPLMTQWSPSRTGWW